MGKTQTKSPFSNDSLWKRGLMHICGSSSTILDRVEMDQFRFSRLPSFSKWDLVWSLICSLRIKSTDTDLGGAKSSIWNFCTRFSDVISRGNQWRMTSRNVGHFLRLSDRKKPVCEHHNNKILSRIKSFRKSRGCFCENRPVRPVLTYPMNDNVSATR